MFILRSQLGAEPSSKTVQYFLPAVSEVDEWINTIKAAKSSSSSPARWSTFPSALSYSSFTVLLLILSVYFQNPQDLWVALGPWRIAVYHVVLFWSTSVDCKGKTCKKHTYVFAWMSNRGLESNLWIIVDLIKWRNTRRARIPSSPKESAVTTGSNQDMVVKPNPSSTRRYVDCWSGCTRLWYNAIIVQAKTTKKVVLRLECTVCKYKMQLSLKRCKQYVPITIIVVLLRLTLITSPALSLVVRRRPRVLRLPSYVFL